MKITNASLMRWAGICRSAFPRGVTENCDTTGTGPRLVGYALMTERPAPAVPADDHQAVPATV
jgi:hypothetical protein